MAAAPSNPTKKTRSKRVILGWREWLALPELGIERIAAKIDTGARTSALHARDMVVVHTEQGMMAEFTPPLLRHQSGANWPGGGVRRVRAPLVDERIVKSSNGDEEPRWVIRTEFVLGGLTFTSELSLTNRAGMTFPVLIGRQALRRRFLVHPGRSHLASAALVAATPLQQELVLPQELVQPELVLPAASNEED
ncbi:MAG TPA: RimK/LysX family protein [Polyangiaceae bacterium]|nr:RimK/LysX family protein [Polyangiaceae bacterium]